MNDLQINLFEEADFFHQLGHPLPYLMIVIHTDIDYSFFQGLSADRYKFCLQAVLYGDSVRALNYTSQFSKRHNTITLSSVVPQKIYA